MSFLILHECISIAPSASRSQPTPVTSCMPTDDMNLPASLREVEQLLLEGPPCGQADIAVRLITTTGLHINNLIIRCQVFDGSHLFWTIRGNASSDGRHASGLSAIGQSFAEVWAATVQQLACSGECQEHGMVTCSNRSDEGWRYVHQVTRVTLSPEQPSACTLCNSDLRYNVYWQCCGDYMCEGCTRNTAEVPCARCEC